MNVKSVLKNVRISLLTVNLCAAKTVILLTLTLKSNLMALPSASVKFLLDSKNMCKFILLSVLTALIVTCRADDDVYAEYFRMRTHISSIVGKSEWIARYTVNKRGEVMGSSFNNDATAFFRFEGQLKPALKGNKEEVVSISSYSKVVVTFSDDKGNIFKFDLFTPVDYKGGSYTHKTYKYLLTSYALYHFEINNESCPYRYAHYTEDPEILQAARLLVKDKSDFIKGLEQRLQLPFGLGLTSEGQALKVNLVMEFSPAWYCGIKKNDVIEHATCDYAKCSLVDLQSKIKGNVKRLELLVNSPSENNNPNRKILTLYRETTLESRLFAPPQ